MEEKRLFFKCLAGKLAIFLLLWGAAMAALVWVNYRWCQEDVIQQYSDLPMRIRTGEVTFTAQPKDLGIVRFLPWEDGYCSAQLTMMGDGLLRDYGGQLFSKLYALTGLSPVILLTLAAAVFLAVLTAWLEYRAIRRERAFTRAAAHELKTPLAILRAHAESLKEDIDPAKRQEYLDVVLSETDRMTALTGSLLNLARLERGEALNREPVELSALVKEVLDRLAQPLEQKGVTLKLDLSPVWTQGDRARLESVASNLVSNALRHCTPGGTVTVKAGKEGRWAVLTVDNDGDNISERELRRLWQPFYRSDQSRSRDTGGTGLGLAIVKAAMKAHGGAYGVSNREGGVTFRVSLPCLQRAR